VSVTLQTIQAAANGDRIKWRYHALQSARQRGITRQQAKDVLRNGAIIEEYPYDEQFPKFLMMAEVQPGKPLYVALAYNETDDYLYVITVHWLDPEKWEDPWTRRPKKL
jgi:hypothetical protein